MKKIAKFTAVALLFLILTILTQIGGIIYLISILLSNKIRYSIRGKRVLVFTSLYLLFTYIIVPVLAPFFGRERIQHTDNIQPANYLTVLLNRNYVVPDINDLLGELEIELRETNVKISYLDANFPFIDKFPLLPHLSHNDGKKLDLSLIYETSDGKISSLQKSMSGYGVFENPKNNESNQIDKCIRNGYFQYDYPKYITFGQINKDLVFSEKGTKILIESILKGSDLGKLFIEPHLKQRLNLDDKRIRYHGCRAVRHDDHIHIQLK